MVTSNTLIKNKISWWRVAFGDKEVEKLRESVANKQISSGPVTEELESKIAEQLNVPYCLVTTSGSAALYLALKAKGIGPSDEVIVPNRTWVATAHAVLLTGAKVVLADVRSEIPVLDVDGLKDAVTSNTKAVLPVHLNGRAVDMNKLNEWARAKGLVVIEDAAQAFLSENAQGYLGAQSDAGCFSMGMGKLISTGQGGFIVTRYKEVYEQLKLLRNHGVVDNFTDTWNQFGFNFKFTDLLSSFGLVQLGKAQQRVTYLKNVYERYCEGLDGLPFLRMLPVNIDSGEVPLYAEILCEQRGKLIDHLAQHNIQARPVPPNLDISHYIPNQRVFPHSTVFAQQGVYLPCGPDQSMDNIDRVMDVIKSFKG